MFRIFNFCPKEEFPVVNFNFFSLPCCIKTSLEAPCDSSEYLQAFSSDYLILNGEVGLEKVICSMLIISEGLHQI